jgi:predicted glycosyltransferase
MISSERPLPPHLERYGFAAPPDVLHDLLAEAALTVGESPTLAMESAMLGVPAIYVGTRSVGYLRMLEHEYGLVHCINSAEHWLSKSLDLLQNPSTPDVYRERRAQYTDRADDLVEVILRSVTEFDPQRIESHPANA